MKGKMPEAHVAGMSVEPGDLTVIYCFIYR
jgi:hypothetical protein